MVKRAQMMDGRVHRVGDRVEFRSSDGDGVGTIAQIRAPKRGVTKFVLSHVVRSDSTKDLGNWPVKDQRTGEVIGHFDALTSHGVSGGCIVRKIGTASHP